MRNIKITLVFVAILFLLVGAVLGYFVNEKFGIQPNNKRQFSTSSSMVSPDDLRNYLEKNVAFTSIDGKPFCESSELSRVDQGFLNYTYLWVLCDEYNSKLELGSGLSGPVVIISETNAEKGEVIITHNMPRDGSMFGDDIREMFPDPEQVFAVQGSGTISELEGRISQRAKEYFKQ